MEIWLYTSEYLEKNINLLTYIILVWKMIDKHDIQLESFVC